MDFDMLIMGVKSIVYEKYITSTDKIEKLQELINKYEEGIKDDTGSNVSECS